jgi:hypothetical protein
MFDLFGVVVSNKERKFEFFFLQVNCLRQVEVIVALSWKTYNRTVTSNKLLKFDSSKTRYYNEQAEGEESTDRGPHSLPSVDVNLRSWLGKNIKFVKC